MKKWNTKKAAEKLVSKSISLGTSRHRCRHQSIDVITSVGTARNHRCALKVFGDWLLEHNGKHIGNSTEMEAAEFLTYRALTVGQAALNLSRQALNFHLFYQKPIPFVTSIVEHKLTNRAYNPKQIDMLVAAASLKMGLSIRIAQHAGLRAVELITITPTKQLQESPRDGWKSERFLGREHETSFTVHGKGGLCREVRLPPSLAIQLLASARLKSVVVKDREVNHSSYFDLVGGANFSAQFSSLSSEVLGKSTGAHGLRHTFAKKRLHDLMCAGLAFSDALQVLANELGHFSTANTFTYLRD